MTIVDWMDRTLYPSQGKNWDDDLFRELILAELAPDAAVLDLGAGAGIVPQMNFKQHAARVCGVDMDERVTANPFLHEGKFGRGEEIPYGDGEFDVVFADNVLEHLDDPGAVFAEVSRVLKPGGVFLAKTPNKFHYMPTVARLTPHSFHGFINKLRGRETVDTFPTRYRANRPSAVAAWAQDAGLELETVQLFEGRPEYLRFNPLTYSLGYAYERAVNGLPGLDGLRILMVAVLRKQAAEELAAA